MLNNIKRFIQQPVYVKYCSQTLYQALLGCCRLYEATSHPKWLERADDLADRLVSIQKHDGGFDIGYDFNFGLLHKAGMATSPEQYATLVLCYYARIGGAVSVTDSIKKSVGWIMKNAQESDRGIYTPYSPENSLKLYVYNGTSFSAAALGSSIGLLQLDGKELSVFKELINFLKLTQERDVQGEGAVWFYNDQKRNDIGTYVKAKIDNYHALQQAEVHLISNSFYKSEDQEQIALEVAKYISFNYLGKIVPYYNAEEYSGGFNQTWGYVSVISLFSNSVIRKNFSNAQEIVEKHLNFLDDLFLPGGYHADAFSLDGRIVDHGYMVRSEAWVFSALAACLKASPLDKGLIEKLEFMFDMMAKADFSGYESHALNKRKRVYGFIKRFVS